MTNKFKQMQTILKEYRKRCNVMDRQPAYKDFVKYVENKATRLCNKQDINKQNDAPFDLNDYGLDPELVHNYWDMLDKVGGFTERQKWARIHKLLDMKLYPEYINKALYLVVDYGRSEMAYLETVAKQRQIDDDGMEYMSTIRKANNEYSKPDIDINEFLEETKRNTNW